MAKIIDITEKLSFGENPRLKIGEEEFEVNADAETILKLMGVMKGDFGFAEFSDAIHLLFNGDDAEKIAGMKQGNKKLSSTSLMQIVNAAIELVMGEDVGE